MSYDSKYFISNVTELFDEQTLDSSLKMVAHDDWFDIQSLENSSKHECPKTTWHWKILSE